MPPPSSNSSAISGEFALRPESRRGGRALVTEREIRTERVASSSFVQELEPSDSDRPTEVPPAREDLDRTLETIPAPELDD